MLNESVNTSSFADNITGHVKVELFDAKSGQLIRAQEKHNFIANHGKEYLRWLQRNNFKSQISSLNGASDTDTQSKECFNSIVLTDSSKSESPSTEWWAPGTLIGWANKTTYSGADIYRGSPNGTLCTTNSTSTKWVFDWPVNAANGTISSICWNNSVSSTEFMSSTTYLTSRSFPGVRPVAYANSNLIFGGSGTTVTVYNSSMSTVTSFTTINCNGIAWDSSNSKLWVISGSQIAAYSQTGTVINAPISITSRSYRGLTYDGTNLWTTVIGDNNIYCIATNGSAVSNFSIAQINSEENISTYWGLNSGRDIMWDSTNNLLLITLGGYSSLSQRMYRYNSSGTQVGLPVLLNAWDGSSYQSNYLYNYYNYSSYRSTTYFDLIDESNLIFPVTTPSNSYIYTSRIDGMGSRVKLPSTITKTNTQTLRVTYQMDYV